MIAAIGFTVASAMCATATSLSQMIVYRAMQGFIGGAMMPTVFPVVYTVFPPRQLAPLMVMISLILNLSSTLGPTIGGYLTDTLFLALAVPGQHRARHRRRHRGVAADRHRQARPARCCAISTLIGLVLMAVFLGCLEYALEEGPRWDWFADNTILAAVGRFGDCGRRCSSGAC